MSTTLFIKLKGTCHCGCNFITNLRHWDEGMCEGWWAECSQCRTTRFLPESKIEKKAA